MLNEMLIGRFLCPVCERIIYFPIRGYWCPYCGASLNQDELVEEVTTSSRITDRDERGRPYYKGKYTFRSRAYSQDMSLAAIDEMLEKLTQYEENET